MLQWLCVVLLAALLTGCSIGRIPTSTKRPTWVQPTRSTRDTLLALAAPPPTDPIEEDVPSPPSGQSSPTPQPATVTPAPTATAQPSPTPLPSPTQVPSTATPRPTSTPAPVPTAAPTQPPTRIQVPGSVEGRGVSFTTQPPTFSDVSDGKKSPCQAVYIPARIVNNTGHPLNVPTLFSDAYALINGKRHKVSVSKIGGSNAWWCSTPSVGFLGTGVTDAELYVESSNQELSNATSFQIFIPTLVPDRLMGIVLTVEVPR